MPTGRDRIETFEVRGGRLVRSVVPARGKPYEHRCPRESFETIAHAVDEFGEAGFTLETLVEREALPLTQVAVALAFLKERGVTGRATGGITRRPTGLTWTPLSNRVPSPRTIPDGGRVGAGCEGG